MLRQFRIPLNAAEEDAGTEPLADRPEGTTLSRNEPGETGPGGVDSGTRAYLVHEDGRVEEVS